MPRRCNLVPGGTGCQFLRLLLEGGEVKAKVVRPVVAEGTKELSGDPLHVPLGRFLLQLCHRSTAASQKIMKVEMTGQSVQWS